jgi:4-hydroxyphenylpyruvate dioxygenase-like putative hemolysin
MGKGQNTPLTGLHHIGLIVNDVQKAIKALSAAGIGPFETAPMKDLSDRTYRGKPVQSSTEVWFASLGQVNLELVHPLEGESLQKETLETRGEGIEHIGFFVDNLWEKVDRMVQNGCKLLASAKAPQGGGWAFLQTEEDCGLYLELVEPWE